MNIFVVLQFTFTQGKIANKKNQGWEAGNKATIVGDNISERCEVLPTHAWLGVYIPSCSQATINFLSLYYKYTAYWKVTGGLRTKLKFTINLISKLLIKSSITK